jgi:hypothetical protein
MLPPAAAPQGHGSCVDLSCAYNGNHRDALIVRRENAARQRFIGVIEDRAKLAGAKGVPLRELHTLAVPGIPAGWRPGRE